MGRGIAANQLRGIVPRAVIHHQNLHVPALLVDVVQDLLQGGTQASTLIVGGHDNAVLRPAGAGARTGRRLSGFHAHAACSFFFSMAKNSGTSSGFDRPLLASSIMVRSASSCVRAGLYGRAVRKASYTSTTCKIRASKGML